MLVLNTFLKLQDLPENLMTMFIFNFQEKSKRHISPNLSDQVILAD